MIGLMTHVHLRAEAEARGCIAGGVGGDALRELVERRASSRRGVHFCCDEPRSRRRVGLCLWPLSSFDDVAPLLLYRAVSQPRALYRAAPV